MATTNDTSIYDYDVANLKGETVKLYQYKGKVLLVVNTASGCGFTPQLKDLQQLYNDYKDKGFEVLAFPSNEFGGQEPLEGEAIQEFCDISFKTTFPIFNKIHVKGDEQHPLYAFLTDGSFLKTPRWNFHKFLVDKQGQVYDFYLPTTNPDSSKVRKAIEKLL